MCTVSGFFSMVWLDTVFQEVLKWVSMSWFLFPFLFHCVDAFLGRLTFSRMAFGYVASTARIGLCRQAHDLSRPLGL